VNRFHLLLNLKSFNFKVGFDFLLTVTSLLQTFDGSLSPLGLERVKLAKFWKAYSLWKQSISEIAASLAT
jgi:hypothetical protein